MFCVEEDRMIMNNQITIKSTHFPWLDAMRFIAAFMVLLCHTRNDFFLRYYELPLDQQGPLMMVFYTLGRMGNEAVFTFFILSGFLVGGRGLERIINGTFRMRDYAIDRSVRIMLPLIASVALYLIVAPIVGEEYTWWTVVGNLLSLQCILCGSLVSPFWSLSYEVWFYIWLLALASVLQKRWWGFPLFVLCCFVYTRMNAAYLLVWLMGGASYLCRPKTFNIWLFLLSWIIIVVGAACCQMTTETKFAGGLQLSIDGFVFRVLLCVGMCLLAQQLILLPPKGRIMKKVESVFSRLADFSYTLYLTHRITLLVIFTFFFEKYKADMSFLNKMLFLGILSVCLLVAYMLYWMAERHTKTVKKYIKAHLM